MTGNTAPLLPQHESAWRRRVIAPIAGQLRQGTTPETIALTIALGLTLGIFPILGATTLLCGIAAAWLRLNQPIIQLVNYVVYPVQLITIVPFYRAGETLFGRPYLPLSMPLLIEQFRDDRARFVGDFGMIAVGGVVVWSVIAPVFAAALYFTLRAPIRGLAKRGRRMPRIAE